MRRNIIPAAVLLLALGFASPGRAQGAATGLDLGLAAPKHVQACTILSLDSVSINFVCRDRRSVRQYWVTRTTQFVARWPNPSFFDLGTGEPVQVISHDAGRTRVADIVRF